MNPPRRSAISILAVLLLSPIVGEDVPLPPPVELDARADHRRTLELLGVESIRRGANGRDASAPNAANYDESKATVYPSLPDPLLTQDRRRVDSPELWRSVRRPEIVELFDREVYGRVPESVPAVTWKVVSTIEGKSGETPTITRELVGHVDNSSYPHISVDIEMNVTTPARAIGPIPAILQFSGGFFFRRPSGGQRPGGRRRFGGRFGRGSSWRDMVIARGWGHAAINTSSIQADNGGGLTKGIIGLVNKGRPRSLDDWGALRAWAWGASRALDFFETDPMVDASRVGLEGHSRWGKATLVAMAYDERFAAAYVSSSGAGGASLHRRNFGEIIENVAGSGEYHWMAGNFIKYAGPLTWDDLPVDAHELVALCAPRPVFISSGASGDQWVDAKGMFLAAAHAQPVYELLGAKTMGTSEFPALETALTDGEIAFRQHSGGHTDGPNWPTFIEFAARYFEPSWKEVSATVLEEFEKAGEKLDWPGGTAGVAVDPASGDVFMVVPGQGLWKSTDRGGTFARVDGGVIGGRCETSYSLQFDSSGRRLACFMLDGGCGMTPDGGATWTSFTGLGRNWDYAAVDWSSRKVENILGARHETGGEVFLSNDAGKTWERLFVAPEFERTGGLGIFGARTLVYTMKGRGIQRSTDAGKTWERVSEIEPIGRVARIRGGTAYWLSPKGILASSDRGMTWTVRGEAVDASIGPYFDPANKEHLAVAGVRGIFESSDGGASWQRVAPLPEKFDLPKAGWYSNVAWDPGRGLYYASRMGRGTFRLESRRR